MRQLENRLSDRTQITGSVKVSNAFGRVSDLFDCTTRAACLRLLLWQNSKLEFRQDAKRQTKFDERHSEFDSFWGRDWECTDWARLELAVINCKQSWGENFILEVMNKFRIFPEFGNAKIDDGMAIKVNPWKSKQARWDKTETAPTNLNQIERVCQDVHRSDINTTTQKAEHN